MILDILTLGAVVVGGLLIWRFLPQYVSKKAENLATKEDVASITKEVEAAREPYAQALEAFRARLELERDVLTNRQELYVEFAEAISDVFISGRTATESEVRRFHAKHAAAFLAAPDHVVQALNRHLDVQVVANQVGKNKVQKELRKTFGELLITLRKEAFFPETDLMNTDFRFVSVQASAEAAPLEEESEA